MREQEAALRERVRRSESTVCNRLEQEANGAACPSQKPDLGGHQRHPSEPLIKRILVPTDFSAASSIAVERAVAIANQCGATLTILHVIDINAQPAPGESGSAEYFTKRLWDNASVQMSQLAWSLIGRVSVQTAMEEGLPWEEITGKSHDFDLIILAKAPAKSPWNFFSSHIFARVINQAQCPVMVVNGQ